MTNHDELTARIDEMTTVYKSARDRITELTLLDIAVTARATFPDARWVGLVNGDTDASGMQWPTSILTEGALLAGTGAFAMTVVADHILSEVQVGNLDEATSHIWGHFTCEPGDFDDIRTIKANNLAKEDPAADRFLDLDAVLATWAPE